MLERGQVGDRSDGINDIYRWNIIRDMSPNTEPVVQDDPHYQLICPMPYSCLSCDVVMLHILQLPIVQSQNSLVNIHALSPQICPRHIDLLHKLRMRLGNVVECENAVSEFEEEVCTEGNEGPEWKLSKSTMSVGCFFFKILGMKREARAIAVWIVKVHG